LRRPSAGLATSRPTPLSHSRLLRYISFGCFGDDRAVHDPAAEPAASCAKSDQIRAGNMVIMPDVGPVPIGSVLNTSP
jgi:hypothetical protein